MTAIREWVILRKLLTADRMLTVLSTVTGAEAMSEINPENY